VVERRHLQETGERHRGYSISGPRDIGSRFWASGIFPADESTAAMPSLEWRDHREG
jgi:hypothetical protein